MGILKEIDKISEKQKQDLKIRFLDDCLLIDNSILVFGDVHIGYEEYLYRKSLFVRTQFKEIIEKLNKIFDLLDEAGIKIEKVIILGDLKHEFGEISDSEWRETLQFLDYLSEKTKEIILIKGNHDNILGPIARKRDVKVVDYYREKGVCFLHGDKFFEKCMESEILIMGHLHGSISLRDGYKREKFKCFLHGKWKKKEVYILPSFSPMSFGFDLENLGKIRENKEFLFIENKKLKNFGVIIYNNKENKVYNFGKLKKLIR